MGLAIRTDREPHAGGLHAVYVLESSVAIVSVIREEGKRDAA
jgi:hypothetical protein